LFIELKFALITADI